MLCFLLLTVCISLFLNRNSDNTAPPPPVTVVESSVVDSLYNNPVLGEYLYTGPIDKEKKPHGKGEAKFENGDIYQGDFNHGSFEGHATYIYAIGDKFVGIFKNNYFQQGTYTCGNGNYFRGGFKEGQPDLKSGKWYNALGEEL